MRHHHSTKSWLAPVRVATLGALLAANGCVLAPGAAKEERAAVARAATVYGAPFAERMLPALPPAPTWRDVVSRALAASGEVEAAYFAWAAATHRIDRAGGYPNTPFSIDVSRALSGAGSGFDRTSLRLGFDPMEDLAFPTKVYQAAKVATADARQAGARLVAVRFDLRRRVLIAWAEYGLLAERLRIAEEGAGLRRLLSETAAAGVAGGAGRERLLTAVNTTAIADDAARTLAVELRRARAELNAMLARDPEALLPPPTSDEPPHRLASDDTIVLAVAGTTDPELAVLAHDVEGRREALALARLQYIPDFNPFVGTDGAAAQMAGIVVSIPTLLREVGAMIRERRAELQATLARQRQATFDRGASVVALLALVRDGERRLGLATDVLPATAERAARATELAYANATATFDDVVTARTVLLDLALLAAEARAAHARAVADLEALLGVDVETLGSDPATVVTAEGPR